MKYEFNQIIKTFNEYFSFCGIRDSETLNETKNNLLKKYPEKNNASPFLNFTGVKEGEFFAFLLESSISLTGNPYEKIKLPSSEVLKIISNKDKVSIEYWRGGDINNSIDWDLENVINFDQVDKIINNLIFVRES